MYKKDIENHLLSIVQTFLMELKADQAARALTFNASLEKDLGLGSLERVELTRRIEQAFSIQLPLEVLEKVVTLQDLVHIIEKAKPSATQWQQTFTPHLKQAKSAPQTAQTLTELLLQYAEYEAERPHIYFQEEDGKEKIITYGKLIENAKGVAAVLEKLNIKPKETVAIMLPTTPEFFYVFFGILFTGAIPVPIYPPTQMDRLEEYVHLQAKVLKNADIRLMITLQQGKLLSQLLKTFIPDLRAVLTIEEIKYHDKKTDHYPVTSADLAVIQYTSGSTGDPKGVMLTHQNILANIRAIGESIQIRPTDFMVSWLPLYHDMGLIGAWLGSLYFGIPVCIFSPLIFLLRPERWLWAMHYHRATISGAPNFAYELCVNTLADEKLTGLDLSAWRLALSGAETVQASTLRKFSKKMAPYGFSAKALSPGYGLAESTMGLIFSPLDREPKIDKIDSEILMKTGKAVPTTNDAGLEIVSCGVPLPQHQVRIADEKGNAVAERQVGYLLFNGPSNMLGYYNNPQATERVKVNNWIDSGDLAYQADAEIYLAGRKKDIIISAGRNVYPDEVEKIAVSVPGVIISGVAAFGVADPQTGTEQCVIVAETEEKNKEVREKMAHAIVSKVAAALNIKPNPVILVAPHTVPKTSSGKVQRSQCKQAYQQNRLIRRKNPLWLQFTNLVFSSIKNKVGKGIAIFGKFLYTLYAWTMVLMTIIPVWALIQLSADHFIQRLISGWARLILKLIFCPLKINGALKPLEKGGMIIVANHASNVDAVVLLAALPKNFVFVAKQEVERMPIVSLVVRKLRYILVKRLDLMDSVQNADLIRERLSQGNSVLIFPEGTFTYATGVRAFKMGAFKLAVDFHIPICAVGLRGTRQMLRDKSRLLTPTVLSVEIGQPIMPEHDGWETIGKLRDDFRKQISALCDEPQIDIVSAKLEIK